jgi:hypothetical protein
MSEEKAEVVEEITEEKIEETVEEKKAESAAKEKNKLNSYTYWVSDNNKSRELPEEHRPKKIETPVVAE